jgi:hypothetical protein
MNVKTAVAAVSVAAVAGMAIVGLAGAQALENAEEKAAATLSAQIAADQAVLNAVATEKQFVEAELAEAKRNKMLATFKPSKAWDEWNLAVQFGLDYWEGKLGATPEVRIVRSTVNMCDVPAAGCADVGPNAKGEARLYIAKEFAGNRWAMQAIAVHEIGHALGFPHIDGDFVMAP